jgi:uncharacterized protein (TIGR02145 family)
MKVFPKLTGLLFLILPVILYSCKKEEVPALSTSQINNITTTSAVGGGIITSEGSGAVLNRGVCWSTGTNPTIEDAKTTDGPGTGSFTSNISGLNEGSVYYVRAYATNNAGTGYGSMVTFSTLGQTAAASAVAATNITATSATLNGKVNANYLSAVVTFEYGITTSYGQTITVGQNPVTGSALTDVNAAITGLTPGTVYHFRLKMVNSLGTSYSDDVTFVTVQMVIPSVSTAPVTSVVITTAVSGGNVTSDGGGEITARGVCYNTVGNPTESDQHTSDGKGLGSFTSDLSGLSDSTTYFLRAYAINSAGTGYGNEISFTTYKSNAITDIEGNYYNIVKIGTQAWMAENLKTTKFNDGSSIPVVTDSTLTSQGYSWYNDDISNKATFGALYNWYAASSGTLCPIGWHVPSNTEWHQLVSSLDPGSLLILDESLTAGGKMKETGLVHWLTPNSGATNSSGFTALPNEPMGPFGYFWSTTEVDVSNAWTRELNYGNSEIRIIAIPKNIVFSVRCVKD